MKKFDIAAFGEILIDFTYVSNSDQNQKLFAQNAGGAPANVLVCASKLGVNTAFLGKVGDDIHGNFLKKTLENENVNIDGLIKDKNYFTTLAFVDLDENGERSFSFARNHGADTFMMVDDLDINILKSCRLFHIGSLSLTTDIGDETTNYAIKVAKDSGAIISYDPNYRASLWSDESSAKEKMRSILKYVDVMKISDEECELLTDESDIYLASKKLHQHGVKLVCVTLGKDGAFLSTNNKSLYINGFTPKCVVDTTGAGDSFWGSFLYQVISSMNSGDNIDFDKLSSFVKFSNATASICVEKSGAIRAMPSLDQVNKRLNTM